ncbi:hypothetical protein ACJX0J_022890, partial [Zea mays]
SPVNFLLRTINICSILLLSTMDIMICQVLRSQQCLAFSMFFLPIMESSQQMIQPTTWTQPCSSLSHDWSPFVMQLAVATTLSTLNVKDVIDVMPGLMKS